MKVDLKTIFFSWNLFLSEKRKRNRIISWSTYTDNNWSTLTVWEPEVVTDKEDTVNVAVFCFRKRPQVETRLLSGLWLDHVKYFWPPIGWEDRAVTSFPSQSELSTQRIIPGCAAALEILRPVTQWQHTSWGCQAARRWRSGAGWCWAPTPASPSPTWRAPGVTARRSVPSSMPSDQTWWTGTPWKPTALHSECRHL